MFDYIEMFHNPKRKHTRKGMLSPAEFERRPMTRREGVQETRSYPNDSNYKLLQILRVARLVL